MTQNLKQESLNTFRQKHKNELTELEEKANKHKLIFFADIWTGIIGEPLFTSFDFDEVFDIAYKYGIDRPHPELTRVGYIEFGLMKKKRTYWVYILG